MRNLVLTTFRKDIIESVVLFFISCIVRLASSVVTILLLKSIVDGNLTLGYIYTAVMVVFWYCYQLIHHHAHVISSQLGAKIKCAFTMLLYAKTSKLTSFVIKNQ